MCFIVPGLEIVQIQGPDHPAAVHVELQVEGVALATSLPTAKIRGGGGDKYQHTRDSS